VTEQPPPGRLLGVDFGARRIGVAVSEGSIAVPLIIVEHIDRRRDLERVIALARDRSVDAIVVGLPLLMSGEEGEQARRTRRFGDALARLAGVPVVYHDERLSSFRADADVPARGRGRAHNDASAAAIILQSWIDARAATTPSAEAEGRQ
jgi:putative Holliday junction resolvase